jgi:hypothetical protein
MKSLIEGNGRGDSQLKITNRFAALENSKVNSMDMCKAWDNIRECKR